MTAIQITKGDITRFAGDAIVNAANSQLAGGGGVDGAIHRAAGPALLSACRKIGSCPTGSAVMTPGFDLPARYVIHAVGPVWRDGAHNEAQLLAGCYTRSMEIARDNGFSTIAFPAISCGVYGYPIPAAARVAIETVRDFLRSDEHSIDVSFVCFGEQTYVAFSEALASGGHNTHHT